MPPSRPRAEVVLLMGFLLLQALNGVPLVAK
jgi:hypothetical protein